MNALHELKSKMLEYSIDMKDVICAHIKYGDEYKADKEIILKQGFTGADWDNFLIAMNFEYNEGFGGQCLFGTVWLTNKTWLSRGEYDGSEWWDYNEYPAIPGECEK